MPLNIVPRRPHSLIDQIVRVNHAVKRATESFSAGQRIIQEKKDENTLVSKIYRIHTENRWHCVALGY